MPGRLLLPVPTCGFCHTPSNFKAPTGCPIVQLNSNTIYLESIKSHRLRAQSYENSHPTPLQTQSQEQLSPVLLVIDWRFHQLLPWDPLIYYSGSWDLQKHFTFQINSLLCNSGTARWKSCIGPGRGKGHRARHSPQVSTCSPARKLP